MKVHEISLVKYAGEYWVTLADFSHTRDVSNYADHASVKSAIRTFVVRNNPDKYISFRGEQQIKNLITENKTNNLFILPHFQGHTRTALIHWSILEELTDKFPTLEEYEEDFENFIEEAKEFMDQPKPVQDPESSVIGERAAVIHSLRTQIQRLDEEIKVRQSNREKILQAINALENLDVTEV
ncbi:hypothetical protein BH753_gp175 [Bacillus phage Shbh1]|uniref:Uncharacterized protein n=1 Tax=Bacillus phage Shbh1 TaxID=1796992 RepID=A0A142F1K0_9CAUD|nr:hypothetical protein BH753_gp175 [Bacillus phage Shbh1]AMQ66657.1 hypothetical protein [Bacillus phage Shbh1]